MAEISAARISISTNPFHRQLQPPELALERRIDHARTHLDHQAAQQAGIDLEIDRHLAADRLAQALVDRLALRLGQFLRRDYLRRHLAAPRRQDAEKALDHSWQREQAAVA